MDWDRIARDERVRRRGTESASADVDDRTPEERRAHGRPITAQAREVIEDAKHEMDIAVEHYKRIEVEEREVWCHEFRANVELIARRAIGRLPAQAPGAASDAIREHLAFVLVDLVPPPPARRTSEPRRTKRNASRSEHKPTQAPRTREPKLFAKQAAVEVSARRALAGVHVSWEPAELEIDEWLLVVKDRHVVVARQTLEGAARDSVIRPPLGAPGSLSVRLFGRRGKSVVAIGRCSVGSGR
jgi:hypothetical protein